MIDACRFSFIHDTVIGSHQSAASNHELQPSCRVPWQWLPTGVDRYQPCVVQLQGLPWINGCQWKKKDKSLPCVYHTSSTLVLYQHVLSSKKLDQCVIINHKSTLVPRCCFIATSATHRQPPAFSTPEYPRLLCCQRFSYTEPEGQGTRLGGALCLNMLGTTIPYPSNYLYSR